MDLELIKELFLDVYQIDLEEGNNMRYLNQSIKRISEQYPMTDQGHIDTLEGVDRYTITEDNLIKVSEVYYTVPNQCQTASNTSRTLSSQFTEIYERELYNKLNPIDANLISYNCFELIPAPPAGIRVYYDYERYRTLAEIPELFEDCLLKLFFYYEREGAFRSNMRQNNGNVFSFDRRGNIQSSDSTEMSSPYKEREGELKSIMKEIRNAVMKIRS